MSEWGGWSGGAALAEVERKGEALLVATPYSEAIVQQFRSMPGCFFDRNGARKWVGPEEAMREVLEKLDSAKLAIIDDVPPDDWKPKTIFPDTDGLYAYQSEGVHWLVQNLIRRRAALLADDMGLGKSAQAIRTISAIEQWEITTGSHFRKILILCPAMVVPTWVEQYKRWGHEEPLRLGQKIPKKDGGGRLLKWTGIAVASYDTFRSLWRELEPDVDLVVLDEGHYLSNPKSHRTRAVVRFLDLHELRPYRLMTTGTPVDARPNGLWQLLDILYPGRFGKKGSFEARYCGGHMVEIKGLDKPVWEAKGATNLEELHRRLKPLMLRRVRSEVLELPPVQRIVLPIEMPTKSAEALSKAAQFIADSGAAHDEAIGRMLSEIEEHKIDAACELVANLRAQGRKPLVFTLRKETAKQIADALGIPCVTGDVDNEDRLEALTSSDAAVATLFSASTGLDGLQHHFDCAVFVGLSWVATTMQQGMARLERIGQRQSVDFYFLVALGTLDELVRAKVIERLDNFATIVGDAPAEQALAHDLRGGKSEQELIDELFASLG